MTNRQSPTKTIRQSETSMVKYATMGKPCKGSGNGAFFHVFSLDFPPSVNHCYVTNPYGQRVLKKEGRSWITQSQWIIKCSSHNPTPWYTGQWVFADLRFYMPDKRKRDSHNYLKLLLDAMEGIVVDNDYWLLPRIQYVGLDRDKPRIEVAVCPASGEEKE